MFNLKEIREYEGYSMSQIAKKINISKSTYAQWELGLAIIPLKHLIDLANVYQTSINYILGLTKIQSTREKVKNIDKNIISKNLHKFRIQNNLKQIELGKIVHLSKNSISDYETSKTLISTSCLYELCKKYNISADYILGFSKEKQLLNY